MQKWNRHTSNFALSYKYWTNTSAFFSSFQSFQREHIPNSNWSSLHSKDYIYYLWLDWYWQQYGSGKGHLHEEECSCELHEDLADAEHIQYALQQHLTSSFLVGSASGLTAWRIKHNLKSFQKEKRHLICKLKYIFNLVF